MDSADHMNLRTAASKYKASKYSYDDVYRHIKFHADSGETTCTFKHLDMGMVMSLIKLKYNVSVDTRTKITTVSW